MASTLTIPALVGAPLDAAAHDAAGEALLDLLDKFLRITATNRLKKREASANSLLRGMRSCVQFEVTDGGIRLSIDPQPGEEAHAEQLLHWLEVAWALAWTQHDYVTTFSRPVTPVDVTVTLDPVEVVEREACGCGLCTWALPRVRKWGVKRKGLSELYRRIGEGEDVLAKEILPLVGAGTLPGKKRPKKADTLTATEARAWLALNPGRAF